MSAPALSLSLLNGELKAVTIHRGAIQARWDTPQASDEADDLSALFREIVSKTQPSSHEMALVLAHPRLSAQPIEVPPAKGWTLRRLLDRQAQSIKAFQGPAASSYQPALPTKKSNAVLLHSMPKATLSVLLRAAKQAHLQLVRVLPTTSVLTAQLKALPLEKDEVALLAAETGGSTTVVIGRKDGKIAVGRVLPSSWTKAPDRVWVDLTRSAGFAEQQCGVTVGSVWLFGPGAAEQVEAAQAVVKLPVRVSPVEYTPYYWAEQGAKLPVKNDGNLISAEEREEPQRQRMLTATGIILLVLLLLSLVATGVVEFVRRAELASNREIDRLMVKLQEQKLEWQKKYGEVARKKELVRLVSDEKLLPVPALFLGYLGDVVPDNVVLSDYRVQRTNDAWSVYFSGAVMALTNQAGSVPIEQSLGTLRTNLMTGPFQFEITESVVGRGQGARGAAPAPGRLGSLASASAQSATNRFLIEGIIR